jgi:predicted nucleic acid-binding protein
MIVVDANVIAYYFIQGDRTDEARRLHAADPVWILPALWRHEFLNVLATAGKASVPKKLLLEIWMAASMRLLDCERAVDYAKALMLSVDLGISAYDAQYLALAESLDVPCVTEDKKLVKASRGRALGMAAFLSSRPA